jgi:hypothetical protein
MSRSHPTYWQFSEGILRGHCEAPLFASASRILKSAGGQVMPATSAKPQQAMYQDAGNFPRITALLTAVGRTPRDSAIVLRPTASANVSAVIIMLFSIHNLWKHASPQIVVCEKKAFSP